jgi:hypothetical protein
MRHSLRRRAQAEEKGGSVRERRRKTASGSHKASRWNSCSLCMLSRQVKNLRDNRWEYHQDEMQAQERQQVEEKATVAKLWVSARKRRGSE